MLQADFRVESEFFRGKQGLLFRAMLKRRSERPTSKMAIENCERLQAPLMKSSTLFEDVYILASSTIR